MIAFYAYLALVSLLTVVWILYIASRNPSIVDMFWPLGLLLAGIIYFTNVSLSHPIIISGTLLAIWVTRLSSYIWYTRLKNHHIDKRYLAISKDWSLPVSFGFFLNYQLQAILIWIVALPFYFIATRGQHPLTILDYSAIVICCVGIVGEVVADIQLSKFKKLFPGKICDQGLWRYSRHPNYFFDWLTWLGFALFAASAQYGYAAFISPLLMYVIFNFVTGPITERSSINSRGQAYLLYQQKTGMFFPRIKKR